MNRRSNLFPLAGVLSILALLLGPAVVADSDYNTQSRFPFNFSTMNACADEMVDFSGTVHMTTHRHDNGDGTTTYTTHTNYADVKGIGQKSGTRYVFQENGSVITTFPTPASSDAVVTSRTSIRLASAGRGPNMRVTYEIDYVVTGGTTQLTLFDFQLDCTPK